MARLRKGFTLVELLVVTVLGSLIVMATLQVLITNQRTYTAQNAKIQGQQSTRAALDVLSAELREVSGQDGDIIAMAADSLSIRVMKNFGVVCTVSLPAFPLAPVLTILKVGDDFADDDSVFVFADNNPNLATDDVWFSGEITAVDTTATCGAQEATEATFGGQAANFLANTVGTGAPLRSFDHYTYALTSYSGETYLGRKKAGDPWEPMVGPLKPSRGLEFRYLDQLGAVTTDPTAVRRIGITIRTASGVTNSQGTTVSDSVSTVVFTRN